MLHYDEPFEQSFNLTADAIAQLDPFRGILWVEKHYLIEFDLRDDPPPKQTSSPKEVEVEKSREEEPSTVTGTDIS